MNSFAAFSCVIPEIVCFPSGNCIARILSDSGMLLKLTVLMTFETGIQTIDAGIEDFDGRRLVIDENIISHLCAPTAISTLHYSESNSRDTPRAEDRRDSSPDRACWGRERP